MNVSKHSFKGSEPQCGAFHSVVQLLAVATSLTAVSVAKLTQQFLQKLAPSLHDAHDQIVPVGVSRRQVPCVHQAMDVALSFSPGLQQVFDGSAFVDVAGDKLPTLLLAVPDRIV